MWQVHGIFGCAEKFELSETVAANVGVRKTGGGRPQITGRSDSKNCRMLTMMCGRSVDVEIIIFQLRSMRNHKIIVFLTRILIIPQQKYWNSFDIYQNASVYTPAKPL